MEITINYKKVALWGTVVLIIDMIIGNLLYMNPIVSGIYSQYEGHSTMKSMDAFGGLSNWIMINVGFSIVFIAILISLYLLLFKSIPGTGWKKGLSFGLIIGIVKAVPEAFNQWMLFNYPTILTITQLINTIISLVIFGIILAAIFNKFNVITHG